MTGGSRRNFLKAGVAAVTSAAPAELRATALPLSSPADDDELRARISRADLDYSQPVRRSEEGMPLGNGRMGTLVWTTRNQIRMQINRVDVYANSCTSNSFFERNNDYCGGCAYVSLDFSFAPGNQFEGQAFRQRLHVFDGAMTVRGAQSAVELIAWPHGDVIAANLETVPGDVEIRLGMLRHMSQYFGADLERFAQEHMAAVETRGHRALCQLLIRDNRIVLTQEFREGSYYNKSAVAIAVAGTAERAGIAGETEVRLIMRPAKQSIVLIASASSFDPAVDIAADALQQIDGVLAKGYRTLRTETFDWWRTFWTKGSVRLESPDGTAEYVEANYHYFLYVMAASSRGRFPPKFNGMLWNTGGDLRTWGAQHWFANTSCYYEALFAANRLDLADPFFAMYWGVKDSCAVAAKQQWGSEGLYIPETVYFDGLEHLPDDIAAEMRELYLMRKPWAERSDKFRHYSETKHPHSSRWNWMASGKWVNGRWEITERGAGPFGNVTHIFGTTAKVAYLFWRRYEFTHDREWLRMRAYPMLKGAAEFYRNHPNVYKGQNGKYHIRYANSNESVWGACDTDEDLSAMRGVFAALLKASVLLETDAPQRPVWTEFAENLADLPTTSDADAIRPANYNGPQIFARGRRPAVKENVGIVPDPNSMPHWFFDLCHGYAQDSRQTALAQSTFDAYFPHGIGAQTPVGVLSKLAIAGAALGRPDATRYLVPNQMRAIQPERSTAYLGGGVLPNRMTLREGPQALDVQRLGRAAEALQIAMLQSTPPVPGGDSVIRLFTAWPREWKASFRLLARGAFVVSASYAGGMVEKAEIQSQVGGECRVQNPWTGSSIRLVRNGQRSEILEGNVVAFPTASGERILLEKLI